MQAMFPMRPAAAAVILAGFLLSGLALAWRRAPWCDEGWFGSAAYHVAQDGREIVPSLEDSPDDPKFNGSGQHIYWMVPLYPAWEGTMARFFGFSLFRLRAYSLLWGVAAIIVWSLVVWQLTGSSRISLLALLLLACDHLFLAKATDIRMDAMAAALGATAILLYLRYRAQNLAIALLLSQSCVILSFLTHPNGGLPAFLDTAALTLLFDRQRLRFSHIVPFAVPHLVGALGWGLYMMQDFPLARVQFGGNGSGRLNGVLAPWASVRTEITQRYLAAFGGTSGTSPLMRIKLITLAGYLAGVLMVARRAKNAAPLLILAAIHTGYFTFMDASKQGAYLVHIVPLLALLLAVAIDDCWERYPRWRRLTAAAVALFVCVQLAARAQTIIFNRQQPDYLAAAAFVQQHTKPGELVVGPTELGFVLGFDRPLSDDMRLGYYTHKQTDLVVVNTEYRNWFETYRRTTPQVFAHIQSVLSSYRPVFHNDTFAVYQRAN
jgi:4-amino-4-deoxy-L-arabinose transferase-like glycosyltransferase